MDFPIQSLIDEERAEAWVLNHFHPEGLYCPKCQASVSEARDKTATSTSLSLQTLSKHLHPQQFRPSQGVLLRGVCLGVSSAKRELNISRQTVLSIRRKLQT